MKINWQRAALSGILGTIAFDLSGIIGIVMLGMPFWGIVMLGMPFWPEAHILAEKLELPLAMAIMGHYGNGILLAIVFAAIAPSLWGPAWARGLTFFTVETVFGIWLFMLPLLGAGPLGLNISPLLPVIVLARHWILGLVVAYVNPIGAPESESAPLAMTSMPAASRT